MSIVLLLAGVSPVAPIPPGIYTNEEEVYFAKEAKRAPPPVIFIDVDAAGKIKPVDPFGRPVAPAPYRTHILRDGGARIIWAYAVDSATRLDKATELRRARTATCWGAVPKAVRKADGSDDWYGARELKLHDQGGRVAFGGGTTGAPEVILRVRNVVWPSGPSRPSLVLYVHKPGSPDRAEAYSWADPGAKRIGINLRWMQASCTIDGTE